MVKENHRLRGTVSKKYSKPRYVPIVPKITMKISEQLTVTI